MTKIQKTLSAIILVSLVYLAYSFAFPTAPGSAPALITSSGVWYRSGNMLRTNPSMPITTGRQNASSTLATTATLTQADINGYSVVSFTPNTSTLTITLPATSTLTSFIPTTGDVTKVVFRNATTTAGVNLVISAGAGMTFKNASTTSTLSPTGVAELTFIRKTNTDMDVLFVNGI